MTLSLVWLSTAKAAPGWFHRNFDFGEHHPRSPTPKAAESSLILRNRWQNTKQILNWKRRRRVLGSVEDSGRGLGLDLGLCLALGSYLKV